MTRYPLAEWVEGPVWKISPPPGFDPWTVKSIASRYNDWANSLCSVVGTVTKKLALDGPRIVVLLQIQTRDISSPKSPNRFGVHPDYYLSGTIGYFLGGKAAEGEGDHHSPHLLPCITNSKKFNHAPHAQFMVPHLVTRPLILLKPNVHNHFHQIPLGYHFYYYY